MFLTQLALTNFRNYRELLLKLEPGLSIFKGDNGQGKTNLLESIFFLATTRSTRAATDREMVSWAASEQAPSFARLEARVQKQSGELHVEIVLREEQPADGQEAPVVSKSIKVNGLPWRASQLVGQINLVLFAPEDLALLTGPPSGRRRYLDITNSQVNHVYLRSLQRFNRVLAQRNHLLRQIRDRRQPAELLEFWTEEMVKAGTYVVRQRMEMVAALNESIGSIYRELTGGLDDLHLVYVGTAARSDGASDVPALAYRERLAEAQGREIEQGVTLIGPHRDDLLCHVGGVNVGTFGSRGQQRLAVLALKLAEAEYMRRQTGEEPILLLDDILSELDVARRRLVLARVLPAGQSLITTADLDAFDRQALDGAARFSVQDGRVVAG